ncbi:response regulator [Candidatus Parcubacteria bacterium]|nr:MAG: response regulator [Candidatus Parcubacteria bacterium]
MEQLASLINSLSSLLWPLLVFFVLWKFAPAIRGIIESAQARKFTLKIGGQELTMEEVSQQQQNLIADLQAQLNELSKVVERLQRGQEVAKAAQDTGEEVAQPSREHVPYRLLWVDDNPKNNSYFLQLLSDAGVQVDLAVSTEEALSRLRDKTYRAVISDMGRKENGKFNPRAGLDLLEQIRQMDSDLPVVFYVSRRQAAEKGETARRLGATLITSSPTTLAGFLKEVFPDLVEARL